MVSGLSSYCCYICCDLLGHVVTTWCLNIIPLNFIQLHDLGLSSNCRYIYYDLLWHVASYMILGLGSYFRYPCHHVVTCQLHDFIFMVVFRVHDLHLDWRDLCHIWITSYSMSGHVTRLHWFRLHQFIQAVIFLVSL